MGCVASCGVGLRLDFNNQLCQELKIKNVFVISAKKVLFGLLGSLFLEVWKYSNLKPSLTGTVGHPLHSLFVYLSKWESDEGMARY